MRREDRELGQEAAMEILNNGKYGVMAVVGKDGYPYGVPLHYVMIEGDVYFHSSVDGGYRTECLTHNPRVSFTVIESEDGIKARSAIVFGVVEFVPDMRMAVLEKLIEKFMPPFAWEKAKGGACLAQNKVVTYCLKAEHITAKWIDKPDQQR